MNTSPFSLPEHDFAGLFPDITKKILLVNLDAIIAGLARAPKPRVPALFMPLVTAATLEHYAFEEIRKALEQTWRYSIADPNKVTLVPGMILAANCRHIMVVHARRKQIFRLLELPDQARFTVSRIQDIQFDGAPNGQHLVSSDYREKLLLDWRHFRIVT